jgi:uncharacterized protein YndB with AHSA1/START domain
MIDLPHRLDRTILIHASRETVFRYFTDSALWASWWGAGSTIGTRVGDRVSIRLSNGIEVLGDLVEIVAPERIAFTYGFASGTPIGVGESLATITLEAVGEDTRVNLRHDFADPVARDHHIQGWRHQLSVFANTVADATVGDAAALVDAWFEAWAEADAAARMRALAAITAVDVRFNDRHSLVEGREELSAQIGAYHHFMPGVRLQRRGDARHCLGTVLADWTFAGADGQERGAGTNVFHVGEGRVIQSVTGVWSPARKE